MFAGLDRTHAHVSKHIILETNIYKVLQKHRSKCKEKLQSWL